MRYIQEFRDNKISKRWLDKINSQLIKGKNYRLMEFCGGHTHVLHRYGLISLLPNAVEMIHGPGCPVCVLPIAKIDQAISLANRGNIIFCTYADMLRVPGSNQNSLLKSKASGAKVKMVYSVEDALRIAEQNPDYEIVFFAIGFETTTPPTAIAIKKAKQLALKNFSVFCNHVLTPVAMQALLEHSKHKTKLDGFVGPAHVSVVIGANAYQKVANQYKKPVVIAGFEPLDMLQAISNLIDMVNSNQIGVQNQYTRAVTDEGNSNAQNVMNEVFSVREQFEWRGLGFIKDSALKINADYAEFDAESRFELPITNSNEHKSCRCADILCGELKPKDCSLFATACTPDNPLGACMVSSEGACAASYAYQHEINYA
jgi:hydrogenase expression/formation protein HypD